MKRLLLVEDLPKDARRAATIAESVGFDEVDARTSLRAAQTHLEKALEGGSPLPDAIVLDLNLGYESGYELLRYWHATPQLATIPVVIWSILGDEQREMCNLFKVTSVVAKWEGDEGLREALVNLLSQPPPEIVQGD
jgi:CheY-like chemotaxis protein